MRRTHGCGELVSDHENEAVVLQGWVNRRRNLGGLLFIDLRDRTGTVQVVAEPDSGAFTYASHACKVSVDIETGNWTNDIGAPELAAVWTDPDFDPTRRAFYYVRVLQIPTPRHTLYDAIALGIDVKETGHPPTIQERAYSSPIWYTP